MGGRDLALGRDEAPTLPWSEAAAFIMYYISPFYRYLGLSCTEKCRKELLTAIRTCTGLGPSSAFHRVHSLDTLDASLPWLAFRRRRPLGLELRLLEACASKSFTVTRRFEPLRNTTRRTLRVKRDCEVSVCPFRRNLIN
jgi:hypothetical protein